MTPQYIKRLLVREPPPEYQSGNQDVFRYFGPFESREDAEKYTAPRAVDAGAIFCLWPPDAS